MFKTLIWLTVGTGKIIRVVPNGVCSLFCVNLFVFKLPKQSLEFF